MVPLVDIRCKLHLVLLLFEVAGAVYAAEYCLHPIEDLDVGSLVDLASAVSADIKACLEGGRDYTGESVKVPGSKLQYPAPHDPENSFCSIHRRNKAFSKWGLLVYKF